MIQHQHQDTEKPVKPDMKKEALFRIQREGHSNKYTIKGETDH